MKTSKCNENHLAVGSHVKTDYLEWTTKRIPTWWRDIYVQIVGFYDTYLRWYWEDLRDEATLMPIRSRVNAYNEEVLKWNSVNPDKPARLTYDINTLLAKRPIDEADIAKCRAWTDMRNTVRQRVLTVRSRFWSTLLAYDTRRLDTYTLEDLFVCILSYDKSPRRHAHLVVVPCKRKHAY
jgi:hypothetical protein